MYVPIRHGPGAGPAAAPPSGSMLILPPAIVMDAPAVNAPELWGTPSQRMWAERAFASVFCATGVCLFVAAITLTAWALYRAGL